MLACNFSYWYSSGLVVWFGILVITLSRGTQMLCDYCLHEFNRWILVLCNIVKSVLLNKFRLRQFIGALSIGIFAHFSMKHHPMHFIRMYIVWAHFQSIGMAFIVIDISNNEYNSVEWSGGRKYNIINNNILEYACDQIWNCPSNFISNRCGQIILVFNTGISSFWLFHPLFFIFCSEQIFNEKNRINEV